MNSLKPALLLILLSASASAQAIVTGIAPAFAAPYLAQRTMISDVSLHEFDVPGSSHPLYAQASGSGANDEVEISWRFGETGPLEASTVLDYEITKHSVVFDLTSVGFLEDGKLLVAGMGRTNGRAVIERWTFAPSSTSGANGENIEIGRVISVETVFAAPSGSDLGLFTAILSGGALGPDSALLTSFPSYRVYKLDIAARTLTLQVDPLASVGPLAAESSLENRWNSTRYWGRHVDYGDCYLLSLFGESMQSDYQIDSLMIYDGNMDGVIDGTLPIFAYTYDSLGLSDPAKWIAR